MASNLIFEFYSEKRLRKRWGLRLGLGLGLRDKIWDLRKKC